LMSTNVKVRGPSKPGRIKSGFFRRKAPSRCLKESICRCDPGRSVYDVTRALIVLQ